MELGQALVWKAVPNIAVEVPAFGFGTQELLVVVVGKLEISVDIAGTESQVQSAGIGVVCDRKKYDV